MSINTEQEWEGIREISRIVAETLRLMHAHVIPGMNTLELDAYGASLLQQFGARSAPKETYRFPGYTCISLNRAFAHGIPSREMIIKEGDLLNIDVSAEKNGFWADNGSSAVVGADLHGHRALVNASKEILMAALRGIRSGNRINETGRLIEKMARERGYTVIRNLTGHGVGRSLHEEPREIANYYDRTYRRKFKKNEVVAVETFIATHSSLAVEQSDGWTFAGNRGGFVAQHEHSVVVTDEEPVILTIANGIN